MKDKRAIRRKQEVKKKNKIKKMVKDSWRNKDLLDNPRQIGKMASTHGASCSCHMCGNPRKYFNEKTKQEIINSEDIDT